MQKMIDFNECEANRRTYGGSAGRKLGIVYQNENYLLKFPGNLKEKELKNISLSYSNSPVSEYIGSQIYHSIGIPVHETLLGFYNDRVVVACKDFRKRGEMLSEFAQIKVTFLPTFFDSNGNETNGTGTDLQEIVKTIEVHPLLRDLGGVSERFWDMFVIDAFIGNPDRNNGNWGVLSDEYDNIRLAPVYDNGNCLNDKWSDEKMKGIMQNPDELERMAYKARTCIFELQGKRLNPYQVILSGKYPECNQAVKRIAPQINMNQINGIIDEVPCISDTRKQFYKTLLQLRNDKILQPALQNLERSKTIQIIPSAKRGHDIEP